MTTELDDQTPGRRRPANEVYLRGRLSADPVEKILPSGDVLLSFRLTVDRPPSRLAASKVRVDSLECVVVRPGLRKTVARASPGDELEVEGSLQRRFWRGPTGATSRYAVAVDSVRRAKSPVSSVRRRVGA